MKTPIKHKSEPDNNYPYTQPHDATANYHDFPISGFVQNIERAAVAVNCRCAYGSIWPQRTLISQHRKRPA